MQKLYSEIIGLPVFNEYSPSPIDLVRDLLIDPENGKVLAFEVRNGRIIVPCDIERMHNGIHIADNDHILAVSDVWRVQEVQKAGIDIVGSRVVGQRSRVCFGKVVDYSIDTTHMVLSQIYAAKTVLFFRFEERIFGYKQIIRIEKGKILVKDSREVLDTEPVKAQSSAFAS